MSMCAFFLVILQFLLYVNVKAMSVASIVACVTVVIFGCQV